MVKEGHHTLRALAQADMASREGEVACLDKAAVCGGAAGIEQGEQVPDCRLLRQPILVLLPSAPAGSHLHLQPQASPHAACKGANNACSHCSAHQPVSCRSNDGADALCILLESGSGICCPCLATSSYLELHAT